MVQFAPTWPNLLFQVMCRLCPGRGSGGRGRGFKRGQGREVDASVFQLPDALGPVPGLPDWGTAVLGWR